MIADLVKNGRSDAPRGVALGRFLAVYGDIKQKSFYERVRNIREQISPADELAQLIPKLSLEKVKLLLSIANGF